MSDNYIERILQIVSAPDYQAEYIKQAVETKPTEGCGPLNLAPIPGPMGEVEMPDGTKHCLPAFVEFPLVPNPFSIPTTENCPNGITFNNGGLKIYNSSPASGTPVDTLTVGLTGTSICNFDFELPSLIIPCYPNGYANSGTSTALYVGTATKENGSVVGGSSAYTTLSVTKPTPCSFGIGLLHNTINAIVCPSGYAVDKVYFNGTVKDTKGVTVAQPTQNTEKFYFKPAPCGSPDMAFGGTIIVPAGGSGGLSTPGTRYYTGMGPPTCTTLPANIAFQGTSGGTIGKNAATGVISVPVLVASGSGYATGHVVSFAGAQITIDSVDEFGGIIGYHVSVSATIGAGASWPANATNVTPATGGGSGAKFGPPQPDYYIDKTNSNNHKMYVAATSGTCDTATWTSLNDGLHSFQIYSTTSGFSVYQGNVFVNWLQVFSATTNIVVSGLTWVWLAITANSVSVNSGVAQAWGPNKIPIGYVNGNVVTQIVKADLFTCL